MNSTKRFFSIVLILTTLFGLLAITAGAAGEIKDALGVVDASALRLRQKPSTSSSIVTNAYRGDYVVVLSKEGDWYQVQYGRKTGYMHSDYLILKQKAEANLGYVKVNCTLANLRSGPSTSHSQVTQARSGAMLYTIGFDSGWYKVLCDGETAYIRSDLADLTAASFGKVTDSVITTEPGATQPPKEDTPAETEPPKETEPPTEPEEEETKPAEPTYLGYAKVTCSVANLRKGPGTNTPVVTQAWRGAKLHVISLENNWYKAEYQGKTVYIRSDLAEMIEESGSTDNGDKDQPTTYLGYAKVTCSVANLRKGPSTSTSVVTQAWRGTRLHIISLENNWYKAEYNGKTVYIRSDLAEMIDESGSSGSSGSSEGDAIAAKAMQYLGSPYVWGGSSPSGFDCSGFTQYVMRASGYSINRTATAQLKNGVSVSRDDLQPGDLVFFSNTYNVNNASHVGIYIGNGEFIHASGSGVGVIISELDSSYYDSRYIGARRVY